MSSTSSSALPSSFSTSFNLRGSDFHRLSQLENNSNKTFKIKFDNKNFKLTREETYLLSP
jgi:hypothetical protein